VLTEYELKIPADKNESTHVAMCYRANGQVYWDYQAVKSALGQ
jgi:hypothetical protein